METGTGPEWALLQEKVELLLHVLGRVGGGHCDEEENEEEEEQQGGQQKQVN